MTRLAAAACLLLAAVAPSRAGTFSDASVGQLIHEGMGNQSSRRDGRGSPRAQQRRKSSPVQLTPGPSDGTAFGFSLAQSQQVTVYGGTAVSTAPLKGQCGVITSAGAGTSTQSAAQLTWAPHDAGEGGGSSVSSGYDCDYSGPLDAGTYAVTVKGSYRNAQSHGQGRGQAQGPGLIYSGEDPTAGGLALSAASATGQADGLRLSFLNRDAAAAAVSATSLAGERLDVKFYRYDVSSGRRRGDRTHGGHGREGAANNGQPETGANTGRGAGGHKTAIIKAGADSTDLASVPLEPGAAYTVVVRGHGSANGLATLTVAATEAAPVHTPVSHTAPQGDRGRVVADGAASGNGDGDGSTPGGSDTPPPPNPDDSGE